MFPRSTLSFRAFHEKHFSSTSQSSFFEAVVLANHQAAEEADESTPEDEQLELEQDALDHDSKTLPHHVQQLRTWLKERQLAQAAHQPQLQYQHQHYYHPYWTHHSLSSSGGWHMDPQAAASHWWSNMYPLQSDGTEGAWHGADGGDDNCEEVGGLRSREEEGQQGNKSEKEQCDDEQQPSVTLTKEAIAIFEFSRRFREQKAKAAKLEKENAKRLRAKRKRAAMLGFAMSDLLSDEGEEDLGSSVGGSMGRAVKRGRGDYTTPSEARVEEKTHGKGHGTDLTISDDDGGDEDDDFGPLVQESPASDISFISIPPVYYERLQDKLYGGSLKSLEKQAQSLHSASDSIPDSQAKAQEIKRTAHEMTQIQYLESLLDRSYEDSLQPTVFSADDDAVALWPGMPLRC